jgi:fluoroacetyl-CoA thioesterase
MTNALAPGLQTVKQFELDASRCITFMGPEAMVYATPWMVSDAEYTCHELIVPLLSAGQSSVGTYVEIHHVGATLAGMNVSVAVTVVAVEGRRVNFEFVVRDDLEEVGTGKHTRFIVESAKTIERLAAKRVRLNSLIQN